MRNERKKYLKYIWTIALSLEIILYLIFYLFRLKIYLFNIINAYFNTTYDVF